MTKKEVKRFIKMHLCEAIKYVNHNTISESQTVLLFKQNGVEGIIVIYPLSTDKAEFIDFEEIDLDTQAEFEAFCRLHHLTN